MKLSVILTTLNRNDKVLRFLTSLRRNAWSSYEIILVDQNPYPENPLPRRDNLIYVHTGLTGKSRALNTGIRYASGEILVFTDDDCIAGRDWLQNIAKFYASHPSVSGVFGQTLPYQPQRYRNMICVATFVRRKALTVTNPDIVFYERLGQGNNMSFRTGALRSVGGFHPRFGPGTATEMGEEPVLLYQLLSRGHQIAFEPSIRIFHDHWVHYRDEQRLQSIYTQGYVAAQAYNYLSGLHTPVLRTIVHKFRQRIPHKLRMFLYDLKKRPFAPGAWHKRELFYAARETFRILKGLCLGVLIRMADRIFTPVTPKGQGQISGKTKTRSLIIIPFALPYDWPADYERTTAGLLSKTNTVIAFLPHEGFTIRSFLSGRKKLLFYENPNLLVFRPFFIIPFHRFRLIKELNIQLSLLEIRSIIRFNRWTGYRKVFWTFSLQYAVSPKLFGREYVKIYDCVDHTAHADPKISAFRDDCEKAIVRDSDTCFANTGTLFRKLHLMSDSVYHVPVGWNEHDFAKPADPEILPPGTKVLFTGVINQRLDVRFIRSLAKLTPGISYYFLGPTDFGYDPAKRHVLSKNLESLKALPNVRFFPPVEKRNLAGWIRACDIGFIPYDTDDGFVRNSFPTKTLEYFYFGKPVISTPIKELIRLYPYVLVVKTSKEAKLAIIRLTSRKWPNKHALAQRRLALRNSFSKKIDAIRVIVKEKYDITI